MTFKNHILESTDIEVLRASNVKKLNWLLNKISIDSKIWNMADSIIFDLKKEKIGFVEVHGNADRIQNKYPDLKGKPEEVEKKIGKDAYKTQYDYRKDELNQDYIDTLKKNLLNAIYLVKKIRDPKVMDTISSNINYFIKGNW